MRPKVALVALPAVGLALAISTLKMTDSSNESNQTRSFHHVNSVPKAGAPPTTIAALPEDSRSVEPESVVEQVDAAKASYSYPLSSAEETDQPTNQQIATPTRGRVPALPGLAEFDIPGSVKQATELRDEADNPIWSRPMEERIVSEVSPRLDFPLVALYAACRSSICGLVYAYDHERDDKPGMYSCLFYSSSCVQLGQELGDELGFNTLHGGYIVQDDGLGYTFIYLSDWRGP